MNVQILFTGGIICFTCRSDAYESEEYSYKDKFESLEIQERWESISKSDSDYYGDQTHPERRSLRARMLVYRILPFQLALALFFKIYLFDAQHVTTLLKLYYL